MLFSFLILALVIYVGLVRPCEAFNARWKKPAPEATVVPSTEDLLTQIRDLLAAQK